MERSKEDYLNLLNETVDFYSEDVSRRAIDAEGSCMYNTEDEKQCAVGRCLTDEAIGKFGTVRADVFGLLKAAKKEGYTFLDEILKEEYRGFNIDFWFQLQRLHDIELYWQKGTGLTKEGKIHVVFTKREFVNNLNQWK